MVETRAEQKGRTRRAILDAGLRLSRDGSLAGLSLRQVAKEVGVVPTAFYRHFSSIDELGLSLVEESFVSLRAMLREVRRGNDPDFGGIIERSTTVLLHHVHTDAEHFGFITRERVGGSPVVREAVRHQLDLVERELATDLGLVPGAETWSAEDLRVVSNLIVTAMVFVVEALLVARGVEAEQAVIRRARTQLRMLVVGAVNWRSHP